MLVWCRSAGVFEDLWHGSMFDFSGRWITGPAPTNMARYEVLERRGGRVFVGDKQTASDHPAQSRDYDLSGPRCDVRTALYGKSNPSIDPAVLDALVVHENPEGFSDRLWFPTPERILGDAPRSP